MFNVPSKLTKNLLQADELVDMVWIWIDAQERLRKVARCKIGQGQSFGQMMKTFYIPDKGLSIYYVIRDGGGGGLPDLLQYYIGGDLPNLLAPSGALIAIPTYY